jgi:tetratricopeptide (TPR) repeat protein
MLNWLKKERCRICKEERATRYCLRHNKDIGWKCCNSYRSDSKCPAPCVYAPKFDEASPLPKIKSDSQTEFFGFVSQYLQFWIHKPQVTLNEATPIKLSETAEGRERLSEWLVGFSYPDADIVKVLNSKLSLILPEPQSMETAESIAQRYLNLIIAQDWDALLAYHTQQNSIEQDRNAIIKESLRNHPLLKKVTRWEIINSGISEDSKQAFAFYELNGKESWSFVFYKDGSNWKIYQQIWGTLQDYYAQKDLFRDIAIAINQKQESIAYNLLNQATDRYLLSADIQYYWGLCYLLSNRNNDAKTSFQKALAFEPDWQEPKFRLALTEMSDKNFETAISLWQALLTKNPDDTNVLNNLGVCWLAMEQIDKAKEAWNQVLRIDPTSEMARNNLEHLNNG